MQLRLHTLLSSDLEEAIIHLCSLLKSHDFVSVGSTCGEFEMFR